jgi:hypothetical protein
MAQLLEAPENPLDPECETRHAGEVFVLMQDVLRAGNATSSDGSDLSVLADRFLLCIWDVDDGTSLWIALQSNGDHEIAHGNKMLYAGTDDNWMNPSKVSRYRDGTIWRLGRRSQPFRHRQQQQRAISKEELTQVQTRISRASIDALL